MLYRDYGTTGMKVSALGMGCMRLPRLADGTGIDQEKAIRLIRAAIDGGINYLDTAFGYSGSEETVGKALQDGYREKIYLATKIPPREVKGPADVARCFDIQQARLQMDYVDMVLVHHVNAENWPQVKSSGMYDALVELKKQGKTKHIGVSIHGPFDLFMDIIDTYEWEMVQIQQNYYDTDKQCTEQAIEVLKQRGIACVIMEPLRGGVLANLPKPIVEMIEQYPIKRTPVEWAFRHCYNYEGVSCILSGMNEFSQLEENLATFAEAVPNSMTDEEKGFIAQLKNTLEGRTAVDCTSCRYCMPCPVGVNIPGTFSALNEISMFDNIRNARRSYMFIQRGGEGADLCIECGTCEAACPQELPIIELLKKARETFA